MNFVSWYINKKGEYKMNIVILARTSFNVIEYSGVKNIAFDGTTYTITKSDNTTVTYAKADYLINMKW